MIYKGTVSGEEKTLSAYGWFIESVRWLDEDNFWEDDREKQAFTDKWTQMIEADPTDKKVLAYIKNNWDVDLQRAYFVTRDRQGASFGEGRTLTAKEWLMQTVEWHDDDEFWESEAEREEFIEYWTSAIEEGRGQEFINYISDIWSIDMESER